nr:hypothetical protein [uncultured Flavobacterium sp.]
MSMYELAEKLQKVAPVVEEIPSYYIYKINTPKGSITMKSDLEYDDFIKKLKNEAKNFTHAKPKRKVR